MTALFSTPSEYAKKIGMSAVTVRKWCQNGTLVATRVGKRWLVDEELTREKLRRERHRPTTEHRGRRTRNGGLPKHALNILNSK